MSTDSFQHFNEFAPLLEIRETEIDGEGPWFWIATDQGAWTGPMEDWKELKPAILEHCPRLRTVVCAGGNQGMYPRLYSNVFQTVYTFEPDPLNYHVLCLNCQREHIIKLQAGLGSKPGTGKINIKSMVNTGTHTLDTDTAGVIPILTLDSFEFPNLDLLQLDVERCEFDVLQGAINTIKKHRPVIIVEIASDPIKVLMENLDYEFVRRVGHADFMFKSKIAGT